MARLRKFSAYRKLERPYTRISKFRKKSFIRSNPNLKIVRFEMGDPKKEFNYTLELVSKTDLQIRHDAIESARQASNRALEKELGKTGYFMKIMIYPFHIIGAAAQVKKGKKVCIVRVNKEGLGTAKDALKRFSKKIPNSYSILVKENKPVTISK